MGKPCFLKITKFFAVALLGTAATIAAVAVLSTPAAATGHDSRQGGGGDVTAKSWDTDNLLYSVGENRYSARTFGIPFHEYSSYTVRTETYRRPAGCIGFYDENNNPQQACWSESDVTRNNEPCQSGVADGFFQTVSGGRNDFPVLEITDPDGEETEEAFKDWGTSRNSGCDEFSVAQDRLVSTVAANGGYYLDSHGNLAAGSLPVHVLAARSLRPARVGWDSRQGFWFDSGLVSTSTGYADRVDAGSTLAVSPSGTSLSVPPNPSWPATKHQNGNVSWSALTSFNSAGHLPLPMAIGGTQSGVWCPTGFHPRGEDGLQRVGRGSGRTLTSLASDAKIQQADKFWCRSDVRYQIGYKKQTHSQTCGVSPRTACPSGVTLPNDRFSAYGRVNCYYTFISLDTANSNTCRYYHPIPQCTDPDSNAKREYTAQELATYTAGEKFPAKTDGTTSCGEAPAGDPPQQAGFTADACVTASLEIYENRIAGSDAEPGVAASERTLAVATGRTAWDLDVTSPHPSTASPPRDTTAGTGDPDGCADGSEDRADHASSPAGTARKQSPAPSYAASDRTDTAAPPNDADGDIDYTAAVKNLAHRYASRVAENTCAAKRAEASLRLALLEAEEKLYKDWMERYEDWAESKKTAFDSWRPTGYPSGTNPNTSSSLSVHPTFYSFKHAKRSKSRLDYADAMSTMYGTRETDAGAAASRTLAKPTVASSWCGDPAGFVKTYSDSVTALKTAADNATTAGTAQTQPSKGPTSTAKPNAGSIGVVDASKLSEGAARVPAEWGTSYTYAYTDSKGKRKSGSSGCWQAGTSPTFGAPAVTYTPGAACIYKAAIPEVLASGTASSVTYASYTFVLSGGGWTRTITVPAATRTAVCSSWQTSSCYASPSTHPSHDGYVSLWNGSLPSVTDFPSTTGSPGKSVSSPALSKLLGKYYPSHADRADLKHSTAQTRNQAATNLGKLDKTESATITPTAFANLAVPASNPATDTEETTQRNAVKRAAETYQDDYTDAYDAAYDQATEDMGGTTTTVRRNGQTETVEVWDNFDWRYETSTLAWGNYQEDPATTYSASTATPRNGTGCDLITVASDGTVSVDATRLDYEGVPLGSPTAASRYGVGDIFGVRTDAQRTCKIRRTRTPELILEYQPSRPSGTDRTKAVSSFYVDYQPTAAAGQPPAERFKLYDEAEVFAVKTSLADGPPVLCYQPGEALVAHVGAKGVKAVKKAVFRHASGFAGGNKKHCYRHPSLAQLVSNGKPQPAFVFFDDTAHSTMASVNVVWQQPTPKIVSKLGSADDLKMMANTVNLVANPAVAYDDATRTSSFYGTYYTFPEDTSTESPSGWDITGHPTLTLASTFTQHQVQAKDTAAKTPTTHAMVFKFVDCVFGIEDVVIAADLAAALAKG